MANKGRQYPIRQEWRLYSGEAGSLAGFPPQTAEFRTTHWVATFSPVPAVNTWFRCFARPWLPGDFEVIYRSANLTPSPNNVQVGVRIKIQPDGSTLCRYGCWVGLTDQIPWGWHDQPSHYAWGPGNVENIFTLPAAGGSIYPVGTVEVRGERWP